MPMSLHFTSIFLLFYPHRWFFFLLSTGDDSIQGCIVAKVAFLVKVALLVKLVVFGSTLGDGFFALQIAKIKLSWVIWRWVPHFFLEDILTFLICVLVGVVCFYRYVYKFLDGLKSSSVLVINFQWKMKKGNALLKNFKAKSSHGVHVGVLSCMMAGLRNRSF